MADRMSDRLPPQDLDAEQATLGAMLMESGAVERARRILLGPKDFYREVHRAIYAAICTVDDAGDPVDLTTVAAVLRRREQLAKCGGGEYLARLIGEVPTTAHVIRYATIVRECAHRRNLILSAAALQALAYDQELPIAELEVRASDELRSWANVREEETATVRIGEDGLGPELQAALIGPPANGLARSGIGALDRAMGGFGGHSTIVVVADTKTGKSIMGQQCILTSARAFRDNEPGTYALAYILEAYGVWRRRAVGWLGGFDSMIFRRGGAGMDVLQAWRDAEQELQTLPLLVNAGRKRAISEILRDARAIVDDRHRYAEVERLGLILIDHAQRLQAPGDMVRKYDPIGLDLEELSNELDVPIILPSQGTQREGYLSTKWATAITENASIVIEMQRGLPDDTPQVRQMRNFGTFACNYSRLNSFGTIPYYVDVGGPDGARYRRDLRMYDETDWRAQGWRTKEQQLEWEENERLKAEAQRSAARRG